MLTCAQSPTARPDGTRGDQGQPTHHDSSQQRGNAPVLGPQQRSGRQVSAPSLEIGETMRRYFFDVRDDPLGPDDTGALCRSLLAARKAAVVMAGNMLRDTPEKFLSGDSLRLEIHAGDGLALSTFTFVAVNAPATLARRSPPSVETGDE